MCVCLCLVAIVVFLLWLNILSLPFSMLLCLSVFLREIIYMYTITCLGWYTQTCKHMQRDRQTDRQTEMFQWADKLSAALQT